MSKKNSNDFYSEIDQIADKQEFVESVKAGFKEVIDPRAVDNQSYPLISLLVMILCAILAGANSITDIHRYSKIKFEMFNRLLGIERAPSYNVFWWLLTRLNPQYIENSFVRWIQALPEGDKERIISIDGKHLRGASRS